MTIQVYTQIEQGQRWLHQYRGCLPLFACILGFTDTGLIPGISAAGETPAERQSTAVADAEFLYFGPRRCPAYPLPVLSAGSSPCLISRAVVDEQNIWVRLFDAGLPLPVPAPCIDLGGMPARCLSGGQALDLSLVNHVLEQGCLWGERLAAEVSQGYAILGECVVGGTTTALAVLTGLGIAAAGKVNSSHPVCNHNQKWALVQAGLRQSGIGALLAGREAIDPLRVVAAVGDPMQVAVAGMAIGASRNCGVLLAGGTQMLAVYALLRAVAETYRLDWDEEQIVVGTTGWVAEDATGDTVGLAETIGSVPLLAAQLDFSLSRYDSLRAYERGYVKEGVGAGGCAIAAQLYQGWDRFRLLRAVESLVEQQQHLRAE